jgi:hypothetical protein
MSGLGDRETAVKPATIPIGTEHADAEIGEVDRAVFIVAITRLPPSEVGPMSAI